MKKNTLITAMALSMSLTLSSCSEDKNNNTQGQTTASNAVVKVAQVSQSESAIMSYIPADTPVLVLFAQDPKNPLPAKMVQSMDKLYSSLGEIIKMSVSDMLKDKKVDTEPEQVADFIDKWLSEEGLQKLGFSMQENEFALYTVDLFPVARLTLAKSHSMAEVLDELMSKANEDEADSASKRAFDGASVYQFGDTETQILAALAGNSLAISFSPTREVDKLMPSLLGFEKPSKNIAQSAQYHDTKSRYNYLGNSIYWLNLRDLADYFVNPAQHDTAMLDIMQIQDDMLSAACKTEILQMFDKFPRIVGGTTLMDNSHLNSHMLIEMTEGIGSKLAKMHGRIPTTQNKDAVFYGVSFDVAAAKEVALEFVTKIESEPYQCEMFADMNAQASTMKAQLSQPLPPFVGNFKGINLVIDELDLDMSKTDPNEMIQSLKGKFLLAVDNPEALQGMAMMAMPDLQKLGLKTGGGAINVSHLIPNTGSQLPINLDHVFVAMGTETIGMSVGEGTDLSLAEDVSNAADSHLLSMNISADLYKKLFEGIAKVADNLPAEAKNQLMLQQTMMQDMLWWKSESINIDFTERGVEFSVNMLY